jgi:hypothetical protein
MTSDEDSDDRLRSARSLPGWLYQHPTVNQKRELDRPGIYAWSKTPREPGGTLLFTIYTPPTVVAPMASFAAIGRPTSVVRIGILFFDSEGAMADASEAVVTCKTIEELEAKGPKLPPCGYPAKTLTMVWQYLDPNNSGTTDMQTILKNEKRLAKNMVILPIECALCWSRLRASAA